MLGACRIEKARAVVVVARPVRGQIARPGVLAFDAHAAEREMPVRHVVEGRDVAVLHGLRHIADEAPLADFIVDPQRVERLTHVRPVAHRDKPLQVESHLLAADARLERAAAHAIDEPDERLLDIERILVDGRNRILAEGPSILELKERLHMLIDARIGMHFGALDHVAVGPRAAEPEARCVVQFEALAQVRAERQIRRRTAAERDVLERIEWLARHARVRQNRPVFLPAVERQRRRPLYGALRCSGRARICRAIGGERVRALCQPAHGERSAGSRFRYRASHRSTHRHFASS